MSDERLMILKMIHDGKITPEQGESLLKALPPDTSGESGKTTSSSSQSAPPPASGFGSFFDLQGRLADVQVKLGELQSKLGATTGSSSGNGKNSGLPFGLGDVNVGQMIDEAVKGVTSLKSESVKSFKQAARVAAKEGRKIRDEAKKTGKNIRIELNINFDDDGRPHNDSKEPETVYSEEIALDLTNRTVFTIINRLGDVKVTGTAGKDPIVKFTRTTWSDSHEEMIALNEVRPQLILSPKGDIQQVLVEADEFEGDHITVDLEFLLPEALRPTIDTTFGDIVCENRANGIGRLETQSGDVRVFNIRADSASEEVIKTRSGGISINQWQVPAIVVESVSGNVDAVGIKSNSVVFRSRSGEVSIDDLQVDGNVTIELSSSDVRLTKGTIEKELMIRTQSGDVTVHEFLTSIAKIDSVSGDISLEKVTVSDSGATLKSVSGDIQAKLLEAPVLMSSTVSGDVVLAFVGPYVGQLNATTISGDVLVTLSRESDVHVEMATQTGTLEPKIALTDQVVNGSRFIAGSLGTGLGKVLLQTVSGDVTVKPQA
jgi:DUF4097 and DUF4098 domain-containing protein YvlB